MARPTKLTPERAELLTGLIASGAYKEVAAVVAGISERTLYFWIARGEAESHEPEINPADWLIGELRQMALEKQVDITGLRTKAQIAERINDAGASPYLQFFQALKEAEANAELYALDRMLKVGEGDWRMWMTYLERTHPERWGRRERGADEYETDTYGGDETEAQRLLDRGSAIKIKMLEAGA